MTAMITAALVPTLVLVFTAEIWDVGFHIRDRIAVAFALGTVLFGALYLCWVQHLFVPRKEKEVLTEHMAVVNAVVFLSVGMGLLGLFVLVGAFVWTLEVYVFPPELMAAWTRFEDESVTLRDKLRLAVFISSLATMTAALAGGLDNRAVVRHFALFSDRP